MHPTASVATAKVLKWIIERLCGHARWLTISNLPQPVLSVLKSTLNFFVTTPADSKIDKIRDFSLPLSDLF